MAVWCGLRKGPVYARDVVEASGFELVGRPIYALDVVEASGFELVGRLVSGSLSDFRVSRGFLTDSPCLAITTCR